MQTISKLAGDLGVKTDTIRYYEKIGLLHEPERTPAGYRLYTDNDAARLRFIKGGQRLGLRLEEIKELLGIKDNGLCPCGHTGSLLRKRIEDLDAELERLTAMRAEMAAMVQAWPEGEEAADGTMRWHCAGELINISPGMADWLCSEPNQCADDSCKEVKYG